MMRFSLPDEIAEMNRKIIGYMFFDKKSHSMRLRDDAPEEIRNMYSKTQEWHDQLRSFNSEEY